MCLYKTGTLDTPGRKRVVWAVCIHNVPHVHPGHVFMPGAQPVAGGQAWLQPGGGEHRAHADRHDDRARARSRYKAMSVVHQDHAECGKGVGSKKSEKIK